MNLIERFRCRFEFRNKQNDKQNLQKIKRESLLMLNSANSKWHKNILIMFRSFNRASYLEIHC